MIQHVHGACNALHNDKGATHACTRPQQRQFAALLATATAGVWKRSNASGRSWKRTLGGGSRAEAS